MQQLKQADGNQYRAQLKASERGPLFLSGNYVDMVVEGGEIGMGVGLANRRYAAVRSMPSYRLLSG